MRLIMILWVFISFSIFSQETAEFKETEVKDTPSKETNTNSEKKWYLYLQGGGGNSSTHSIYEKGTISFGKIGIEYRPNPYIGFGIGVSGNNVSIIEKTDPLVYLPYLLMTENSSSSIEYILPSFLINTAPTSYQLKYNTAQVDFNFHINKDRFLDPYIGFGIIGGVCTGSSTCNVAGGEGRLGVQINFNTLYFFFQTQYQSLNLSTSRISGINIANTIGSVGIGARF